MEPLRGIHSGVVVDNRDPEGLARVRVRLNGESTEIWARLATLMAGPDSGSLFVPAVKDEVLVAFESGDAREAYVIGAMWGAGAKPPAADAEPASVMLIRSRNGATLRICDDADNNRLTVETPGGQRISLEDNPGRVVVEDGNGNAVMLSPSGVEIVAAGKVKLAATIVDVAASMLKVDAGIAKFSGIVRCDTLISNAVVSASYTPGAGNIW